MKTYLSKMIEEQKLDEKTYFEMKPLSLKRALEELKTVLVFTDSGNMLSWADTLDEKATEKMAMNGGDVTVQIPARYTKSKLNEEVHFDEDDFNIVTEA